VAGTSRKVPATAKTRRYRIGMLLEEYPVDVIIGYAHLLTYLEDRLSTVHQSVRFDLKVYKENTIAIDALVKHDMDILKIGGQSYLWASKADPGVTPLVGQNPSKNGAIVTRKDTGIKALTDLKGKRIAAGGTTSTVRLWGTLCLMQEGLSATNIEILERPQAHFGQKAERMRAAPPLGKGEKMSGKSPILHAMLTNGYDACIVSERLFNRFQATNDALLALRAFPSSPVFWLAGSTLPPDIAAGFTEAMVALRDERMFKRLSDNVTSYSEVRVKELKALREAATTISEQFGGEREDSE